MKAIRQAQTREILDAYNREDISYSRMNEMFNELADEFSIDFLEWLTNEKSKYSIMYGNQDKRFATFEKDYTSKELLEIYKKEKGL